MATGSQGVESLGQGPAWAWEGGSVPAPVSGHTSWGLGPQHSRGSCRKSNTKADNPVEDYSSLLPSPSFHMRAGSSQKPDPAEHFLLMSLPLNPPREERTDVSGPLLTSALCPTSVKQTGKTYGSGATSRSLLPAVPGGEYPAQQPGITSRSRITNCSDGNLQRAKRNPLAERRAQSCAGELPSAARSCSPRRPSRRVVAALHDELSALSQLVAWGGRGQPVEKTDSGGQLTIQTSAGHHELHLSLRTNRTALGRLASAPTRIKAPSQGTQSQGRSSTKEHLDPNSWVRNICRILEAAYLQCDAGVAMIFDLKFRNNFSEIIVKVIAGDEKRWGSRHSNVSSLKGSTTVLTFVAQAQILEADYQLHGGQKLGQRQAAEHAGLPQQ
ncbi:hypothetical protein EK904_001517 [Melospiza melodia maxima]|nr:hypothetical protein EK904_001517 [Melospiza melodia maxima]